MTKRDLRMLNHALHMAEMSDAIPYKVGCVVAQKNKIINASFNSSKTHPMQKHFNKERYSADNTPHRVHAEIHALAPFVEEDIDWKNVTVYIARKRKCDGENGMSRPCPACMKMIKSLGIKNIVYTTDFGIAKEQLDEE